MIGKKFGNNYRDITYFNEGEISEEKVYWGMQIRVRRNNKQNEAIS